MAVWLPLLWRVYVAQPDAHALATYDYIQRVAIDNVRYETIERRRISIECK